jgi:hypothetical protein
VYKLLFSAVLATVVSYYIYQIFVYFNKTKNIITLNTLTFIITINFMILFDCFCIPALAYTMVANILIPKSKFAYLTSYIAGCIVIVIICFLLLFVYKLINKKGNLAQLEQNFTEWNIIHHFITANNNILQGKYLLSNKS